MGGFETLWPGVGVGGSVAVDFVNTKDWRGRAQPTELLRTFADLLRWARSAGVLEPREARSLLDWAHAHPRAAARALDAAIELREAIAALFQDQARGRALPSAALERLAAASNEALAGRTLRPDAAGAGAIWTWRELSPVRPAHAAALDAARVLTSSERERIRECGDAECGWLFLDTSRNRSRRWCSMQGCGNRNKVRRFYRRQRQG